MLCPQETILQPVAMSREDLLAEPELRLMLAVLEDAFETLRSGLMAANPVRRRHGLDVLRWVASRDIDSLFSFENVCIALQLDPGYVRAGFARAQRNLPSGRSTEPKVRLRREIGDKHRGFHLTQRRLSA